MPRKSPLLTSPSSLIRDPGHFISLGFGSGLSPVMPGTAGSIVAIPIVALMHWLLSPIAYVIVTLVALIVGIWLCARTGRALGVSDHGSIVWDEIVGMMITCLFLPTMSFGIVSGFVLFRVFDILKPWPINLIDKQVRGGLGVMLDDVVAGLMALAVLQFIALFI